jgi:hypothetical protein
MRPQEVILEFFGDRWSFDGNALVEADREGGHTRAAAIHGEDYPVRVVFLDICVPDVFAANEDQLRSHLITLKSLQAFSRRFSPRP